jgi:hypothetical protein
MPVPWIQQLESLSGYRHIFSPQDSKALLNPVAFSHLVIGVAGRRRHVLSRIGDAGLSYTQRTNMLAHHVVLDPAELPAAGPAWLLAQPELMRSKWADEPSVLPAGPTVPSSDSKPRVCLAWQQIAGDAGWGGVLAETAVGPTVRQASLVFQPGTDMLSLLAESLALLPVELRWRVVFSTYFTKLPAGIECQWRCVVDGTPEADAARRPRQAGLVIDLCRPLGLAEGGGYVAAARTGKSPAATASLQQTLPVAEAEPAVKDRGQPPIDAGTEYPASLDTWSSAVVASSPASSCRPRPPRGQPLRPRRKSPPRWPWFLAVVALLCVAVGVGVLVWTMQVGVGARTNRRQGNVGSVAPTEKETEQANEEPVVAKEKETTDAKSAEKKKTVEVPNAVTKHAHGNESKPAQPQGQQAAVSVEKKNTEQGKTPVENKRGEVRTTTPQAVNGKETEGQQENAKRDPLHAMREKAFDVPRYEYVPAAGRNRASSEGFSFFEMPASEKPVSAKGDKLALICQKGMFPAGWTLDKLESVDDSCAFDCILKKGEGVGRQSRRVARFWIDAERMLKIKWNEDNEKADLANAMRNCPLQITTCDGDEAVVYLRKPVVVTPIAFTELAQGQEYAPSATPVDDFPDGVPAKLEILPPWPVGLIKATPEDDGHSCWLLVADRAVSFRLKMDVQRQGQKATIELTLDDLGVPAGDERVFASTVAASIEKKQKEKKKRQDDKAAKEKAKDSAESKGDQKKKLQDEIRDMTSQIDGLEKRIQEAKQIEQIYRKLKDGGKLHYRVYLPIKKYKVELMGTE